MGWGTWAVTKYLYSGRVMWVDSRSRLYFAAGRGGSHNPSICNCSTHPLISKYLIHNDSFGHYAAAQQQRRFRCSVEGKY
jgi:hypothetical protein